MLVPCLTAPCGFLVDELLELGSTPLLLLLCAATVGWLLLLCYVRLRVWAVCSLAVACGAVGVGRHWRAPRCGELHESSPPTALPARELAIFWHIGAFEQRAARLNEIVGRQHERERPPRSPATPSPRLIHTSSWHTLSAARDAAVLARTGLLERATVHVGLVGPARPPALQQLLRHPHVVVAARNSSGHECVTSRALWRWALQQSCGSGAAYWWPFSAGSEGRLRARVPPHAHAAPPPPRCVPTPQARQRPSCCTCTRAGCGTTRRATRRRGRGNARRTGPSQWSTSPSATGAPRSGRWRAAAPSRPGSSCGRTRRASLAGARASGRCGTTRATSGGRGRASSRGCLTRSRPRATGATGTSAPRTGCTPTGTAGRRTRSCTRPPSARAYPGASTSTRTDVSRHPARVPRRAHRSDTAPSIAVRRRIARSQIRRTCTRALTATTLHARRGRRASRSPDATAALAARTHSRGGRAGAGAHSFRELPCAPGDAWVG